jgi:4-amino-4-deoxy-L-arabinose transferase-like glycosyltransferase
LAGLVLTGTYRFIEVGAYQIADVPIGFYFLAAFISLVLYDEYQSNGLLVLTGLMAGFSAWTKNEGILFLTALILVVFAVYWIRKSWKFALKSISYIVIGALPGLITLVVFKTGYAPQTDVFADLNIGELTKRFLDVSRHLQILKSFPGNLFKITKIWLLILPLVFFLLGKSREPKNSGNGFSAGLLVLLIMAIGYYGVYIITPHDLDWHLRSSMWRLIVQFWPVVLFICFYRMNTTIFRNKLIFPPIVTGNSIKKRSRE